MNCINSAWIKGISAGLALVMILLVLVSCASTPPKQKEEASAVVPESWQVGEHWQYSPQAIWRGTFIGVEYIFGDGLEGQFISSYNLRTSEKERVLELDTEAVRVGPPSIHENWIVWSSANISGRLLSEIDWDELNWDIFLLDLDTAEVRQITTEEHGQTNPMISGNTIVWLDNRHGTGDRYPYPPPLDVYAYDLDTGEEKRLTSDTTAEGYGRLAISGNLVVWTDSRHADPEVIRHGSNEPDYNNEICVYDLATNQERRITNYAGNDRYPTIDGSRIVWLRQFTLREAEVFLYDLDSGQETQVSHDRYAAYSPAIYQDRIVWADARVSKGNTSGDVIEGDKSGAAEIYLYDLDTKQETLLVPSTGTEYTLEVRGQDRTFVNHQVWMNPVIQGEYVVYTLERQIGSIVHAMRLTKK